MLLIEVSRQMIVSKGQSLEAWCIRRRMNSPGGAEQERTETRAWELSPPEELKKSNGGQGLLPLPRC